MNKVRENLILLLIYVAIGVAAASTTAYFLYQDRMEFCKGQAHTAFLKVLNEEMTKRSRVEVYYATSGTRSLVPDIDSLRKVTITSQYGKKKYVIPAYKYYCNIESNDDQQMMHSVILEEYPLSVDSLNMNWSSLLKEAGFRGKSAVRLSVTDLLEQKTVRYSADPVYIAKSDSIFSYYVGYRCEVEMTGFLYWPWWLSFSTKDILLLGGIVVFCFLLFILFEKRDLFYRRFLVKEIPVVVEKEIPVIAVHKSQVHTFQLGDVLFDADARVFKKGDERMKISPQTATLLQGFLEAKDYKLSIEEIQQLLWGNHGNAERMHTAVKRLRDCLSQVSTLSVDNENFSYQLKIPQSIEEKLHFTVNDDREVISGNDLK